MKLQVEMNRDETRSGFIDHAIREKYTKNNILAPRLIPYPRNHTMAKMNRILEKLIKLDQTSTKRQQATIP